MNKVDKALGEIDGEWEYAHDVGEVQKARGDAEARRQIMTEIRGLIHDELGQLPLILDE